MMNLSVGGNRTRDHWVRSENAIYRLHLYGRSIDHYFSILFLFSFNTYT